MKNRPAFMRFMALCSIGGFMLLSSLHNAAASPWAEKEGYGAKTGGKLTFGLKHTLFSWMNPWAEAHDPVYETPWTGFCAGIGKAVVYTAAGAIQLVTFPIPVDFPNVGLGMHIPANHQGVVVKGQKKSGSQSGLTAAAAVPELDPTLSGGADESSISEPSEVQNTAKTAVKKNPSLQPSETAQNTGLEKRTPQVIK